MATYTANYGLHQWEASDNFLRTDFNTDFGIIDGALGEKSGAVTGVFVGDNTAQRKIELGFTPVAVLLLGQYPSIRDGEHVNGGLALQGYPVLVNREGGVPAITITEGGFYVYYEYSPYGNRGTNSGTKYYLAFR